MTKNISILPQYWLGGMFSPEAFIIATRQTTAQVILFIKELFFFVIFFIFLVNKLEFRRIRTLS